MAIIAGLIGWIYNLKEGTDREVSNGLIINAIATATALPSSGPAPLEVSFIFNETHNIDSIRVTETRWDFGDGTPELKADSMGLKHIYKEEGTYRARLIVKDNYGRTRIDNIDIVVLPPDTLTPKPPRLGIRANPLNGIEPLEVNFTSQTEGIAGAEYLWEFGDPSPSILPNPTHEYKRRGVYNVRLTVRDNHGVTYMDSTTITVGQLGPFNSDPPVARAKRFDIEGNEEGLTYGFSAAESTDDIGIDRYLWEFHDRTISSDIQTTHTFDASGTYNVRLSVWDEEGQSDTNTLQIVVNNDSTQQGPIPRIIGVNATASVSRGVPPLEVSFSGTNADDDGSTFSYEWDFKDGSGIATQQNPVHTFADPGVYPVILKVKGHQVFGTATIDITVDPSPPIPPSPPSAIAEASTLEGRVPLKVEFTAGNSTPIDSIKTFNWVFNDENITSDIRDTSHEFKEIGNYDVVLTVTSNSGLTDSDTLSIAVVKDQAPVAVISPSSNEGAIPFDIVLDGNNSSDDGTIVGYNWFLGDSLITNNTEHSSTIKHKFVDIGTHFVRLEVIDDIGQSGVTQIEITAIDRIPPKPVPVEALTWMQRFRGIQQQHLPKEFDNANTWKNFSIIPDSLNIMGILIPDDVLDEDIAPERHRALLFFFTNDGRGDAGRKVFKFRNEVTKSEIKNLLRSERFGFNALIRQARRDAQNNNDGNIRKFIAPNQATVRVDTSDIKDLARMLERNKINDKTLNVYYTLFPLSHFEDDVQDTILDIYTRLTPLKGQE